MVVEQQEWIELLDDVRNGREIASHAEAVADPMQARRAIIHGDARHKRADARRDKRVEREGYRVLRLPAQLVLSNLAQAAEQVLATLGA